MLFVIKNRFFMYTINKIF